MKRQSKLFWHGVTYARGTLSAKGYDEADKVIAETKVETTGAAARIILTPDRAMINADGEDVAIFTVAAVDSDGRIVPLAHHQVSFALAGAGRIIGVGNGDPNCHEPDVLVGAQVNWSRSLFNGLAQLIVQSTRAAGEIKIKASADGLAPDTITVKTRTSAPRPFVP